VHNPKIDLEINLAHGSKSKLSLGAEKDIQLVEIDYGPLTIFNLELQINPEVFPSVGVEVDLEGTFGPGGFLKGKIKLFDYTLIP
jgi:hypothetical protein